MSPVDVSIVVATYDRPALLAVTLASCLGQQNDLRQVREIVVVDNHPSRNGRAVVDDLVPRAALPIRYVADPVRNMSALRNRGFAEARGRWVAFVDDDEVADHDWLDELIGAALKTGSQIAVGPRLARFAAGRPPAWNPSGSDFARDIHLPDLARIDLTAADGKPRYGLGTGNSAFDMPACFPDGAPPMRLEFGDAGGEDAELFVRLHREGRRLVWAKKAVVTETVPEHRTLAAYRLTRVRRETQHYCSIYLDATPRPGPVRALLTLKGLAQLAAGARDRGAHGRIRLRKAADRAPAHGPRARQTHLAQADRLHHRAKILLKMRTTRPSGELTSLSNGPSGEVCFP